MTGDARPLDVYLKGSDPTNQELRTIPADLFAAWPVDSDPPPLALLLYGKERTPG